VSDLEQIIKEIAASVGRMPSSDVKALRQQIDALKILKDRRLFELSVFYGTVKGIIEVRKLHGDKPALDMLELSFHETEQAIVKLDAALDQLGEGHGREAKDEQPKTC
jgi:hypothetical protein